MPAPCASRFAGPVTEQTAQQRAQQSQPGYDGMWVDPAHDPRDTDEPPVGEKGTLRQYLDHYRMTFELKCEGLTHEQLATRSVEPSTMSLLGLVRHLAKVEQHWFRRVLEAQEDLPHLYDSEEDPDLDFNGAAGTEECVAEAWATWRREVAHSREVFERCDDLGGTFVPGEPWTVRGVVVHMIEEYARHAGHADLLRECLDGRTGQ